MRLLRPALQPRLARRPRAARAWLPLLAAVTALLPQLACSRAAGRPAPPGSPPVRVVVATVSREPYAVEWHGIGTVEALATIAVRARVGGELQAVHFSDGEEVRAGAPLLTIDPRPYRAALAEAQSRMARDQAMAADAQANVARYAELVGKEYVTRAQYDSIVANAEALSATVAADQAAVESARLELAYCTIASPIAGKTGALLVQRGNLVKANDVPLLSIAQMDPIQVGFALPQQYLSQVRHGGLAVAVQPTEDAGVPVGGTLVFIDNRVNSTTGTLQLKATFPNLDRRLWPGQFVNVTLRLSTVENAVVAPVQAVQTGQHGDFAFVVRDDGTAEMRPLEVTRVDGGRALVAGGLEAGERVVVEGHLRLVPGAKVEIVAPAEQSAPEAGAPAAPGAS